MLSKSPEVRGQQLYLPTSPEPVCSVDSDAWFGWLETAGRGLSLPQLGAGRDDAWARATGIAYFPAPGTASSRALWYAYKRNHGVLHKRYVGKSAALTSARLDEVAVELSRVW